MLDRTPLRLLFAALVASPFLFAQDQKPQGAADATEPVRHVIEDGQVQSAEAQVLAWITPWLWAFFRVLGLFTTAPVISMRMVPRRVRIGLALLIVVAAQPGLPEPPPISLNSPEALMVILQQVLIGATIGFAAPTALAAMTLEVYYRHQPLHERGQRMARAPASAAAP